MILYRIQYIDIIDLSTCAWDGQANKHSNLNKKEYHQKMLSVYKPGNSYCLSEKLCMIKNANNPNKINKRNDIGSKCMHTLKFLFDKTWFFKIIYTPFNFQINNVNLTSFFFHIPLSFESMTEVSSARKILNCNI